MKRLFGVVGLSRARACEKDADAMLQTAIEYLGDKLSPPTPSRWSPSARTRASP